MEHRRVLRAAFAAAGTALAATAAALDPQQFVAGWPIEIPAEAEVFDVPLTAEVYAAADGVEQIAVLDANGAPQSCSAPTSWTRRNASPIASSSCTADVCWCRGRRSN